MSNEGAEDRVLPLPVANPTKRVRGAREARRVEAELARHAIP